jgi:hypothetical protein
MIKVSDVLHNGLSEVVAVMLRPADGAHVISGLQIETR